MGTLCLALLGTPEVRHAEHVLRFPSRKALALLIYLAVEDGLQTRERLMALFWPESDETRSRWALRRTLVYLRDALSEEVIPDHLSHLITERGSLGFNVTSEVEVDLHTLQNAFKSARTPSRAENLQGEARRGLLSQFQAAVDQYRGDFLAGFSLGDAADFDDWVRLQRELWHRRMSTVFDRLSQMQFDGGEIAGALETTTRWVAHDFLDEMTYRRLMQVYVAVGDRNAALHTYENCRAMLEKEFRTKPTPETQALAERMRATARVAPTILPQQASSRTLQPSHTPSPVSVLPAVPLVGRATEYSTLIELYHAVERGQARVVVLKGEAGIGKTRLASEFLGWCAAQGADSFQGRVFETGGHLPYQALVAALRSRLEGENAPDDLLSDIWLTELARLLPELRDRYPDLPSPTGDETTARIRLFEAITRLLQALAQRRSVVLFLDDLQWADAASLDVLHYAGRRWRESGTPLLLLVSLRTGTLLTTPALAKWLAGLEHHLQVTNLTLDTLTFEDTVQLVQALGVGGWEPKTGKQSPSNLEEFSRWLFVETGGQPFYVMELLKALLERGFLVPSLQADGRWVIDFEATAPTEANLQGILPSSIREVIRARLQLLTPAAFALLAAGAVLGQGFTFERLCQVAGLGELEGLAALDEVLSSQLVREDQGEEDRAVARSYFFTHDRIRDVVYTEAGDARRRVFHRRALEVLLAQAAPAAQLAHHARAAGQFEPAFRWSLAAGDEARQVFAHTGARMHYLEALESLSHLPDTAENCSHRVDTILKKVGVSVLSDAPEQNLMLLSEAEALLRTLPDAQEVPAGRRLRLARIHFWMGRVHYYRNDRRGALDAFRQALAVAQEEEDEELAATSSSGLGRVLVHQGYFGQARPLLAQALPLLERAANGTEYILTAGYLGQALAFCGLYQEGVAQAHRALALARETHNLTARAICHLYLALAYIVGGDLPHALQESRSIVSVATHSGDRLAVYLGHGLQAWVESRLSHHEDALARMAQQHAIAQSLGGRRLIIDDWFAAIKAEIALNTGRIEEALTLAEEAVAYAQSIDGKYAQGLAQRIWGQALAVLTPARWEEVEGHMAASLQAFEAGEVLPDMARTHRAWGLLCCGHQNLTAARSHLEEAVSLFEACGLTDEGERTRKLIVGLHYGFAVT